MTRIQNSDLPAHIGIIMDGNGRWAQRTGKVRVIGHHYGMQTVKTAISYCSRRGVQILTLYAFSTENWKRPKSEINVLMNLIVEYLIRETPEMKANNVVLNYIGDLSKLPERSLDAIGDSVRETKDNDGLLVNIALNYGGRADIVRAFNAISEAREQGKFTKIPLEESDISNFLYTAGQPDPDLIIRTGGERRLSNFLTWQSAYSELYFTDVLWPDFSDKDFDEAIGYYKNRERRYGGLV